MIPAVTVKSYLPPPVNRQEIWRYAGMPKPDGEREALLDECLAEALPHLSYRLVYTALPVTRTDTGLDLGAFSVSSVALLKNLAGASSVILFAATVGAELDRILARAAVTAPSRALLLQAIGAERIEALADAFCRELAASFAKEGAVLSPRFSPGYGDLSLALERDIFALLDCPRKIGLTLNESLLMSPVKSVTAFVGIKRP